MIKVLHTADWHLGKRLEQCERTDEHQYFLDWLIETLNAESIDVLIVAGDIFDTGTPSNTAIKQYFYFLWKASHTCCKDVVIIGGNHDSVSTLNAPKDLLKIFNVHVVGGVPDNFEDQIILIKNKDSKTELIVCAVPFLRDKDVRLSVAGETATELEARLKKGICDHYHNFKEYIADYKAANVPVIATGHLYTAGATNSDSEKDIHVGNLGQICGDQFPTEFDYIALGHLHRPQLVNSMNHIRYSGSPIPLSFSEADDGKVVKLLQFEAGKLTNINCIKIPPCRKLIRIKGDLETVKAKLELVQDQGLVFPSWIEVQLLTQSLVHDLEEQLNKLISNKPFIAQMFIRQAVIRKSQGLNEHIIETQDLADLNLMSVFKKKLESTFGELDMAELEKTFNEAIELSQTEAC